MYSVADSVSKTIRTHNLKAGIYWEWNQKVETSGGNSQGFYQAIGENGAGTVSLVPSETFSVMGEWLPERAR